MLQVEIEVVLRRIDKWISEEKKVLAQHRAEGKDSGVKLSKSIISDLRKMKTRLKSRGQSDN